MSDRPAEYQTNQPFEYVVGGSLPLDAVSYVKRSADDEFFAGLKAGKFCYVLNSRQMGKSSLRVRTMARLQADGVVCVSIDMTAIGSKDVNVSQWYFGMLWAIVKPVREQTIGLEIWTLALLRDWWIDHDKLPLIQRWGEFLEEVLLEKVSNRIVIFIDEIDSVLGLAFSVDDFFAAIRESHNRRVDSPKYNRLTFALLGVCAPQDLIQDKRRTPFNIGQAIELSGFTDSEAITLAVGLPGETKTLRSILEWTGGQPFLTQRVCRLVKEKVEMPISPQLFDENRVIEQIVLAQIIQVWDTDDEQVHFQTVQERMMADKLLAEAMLKIYQEMLINGKITANTSAEHMALRLTGVVVKRGGELEISNRIYTEVFGQEWVHLKLQSLDKIIEAKIREDIIGKNIINQTYYPALIDTSDVRARLLRVMLSEYARRRQHSLHNLVMVDMGFQVHGEAIGRPEPLLLAPEPETVDRTLTIAGHKGGRAIPIQQSLLDVYNQVEINGKLLILGNPGSGKTTELLKFATTLTEKAILNPVEPIPVLLDLSTWTEDTMETWITARLKRLYNVDGVIAQALLWNEQLVLLLDGLNELGLTRQERAIVEINRFLAETGYPHCMVCCRSEEYEVGRERLSQLNGAIYLKPLSDGQIQRYLEGVGRSPFWGNIEHHSALLTLARSPLLLTMMVTVYQDRQIRTSEELLDLYIDDAFTRNSALKSTRKGDRVTPRPQVMHYLHCLARQLKLQSSTELLIERIQPSRSLSLARAIG